MNAKSSPPPTIFFSVFMNHALPLPLKVIKKDNFKIPEILKINVNDIIFRGNRDIFLSNASVIKSDY